MKITIIKYLKILFSILLLSFIIYNLFFKVFFPSKINAFLVQLIIQSSFITQVSFLLRNLNSNIIIQINEFFYQLSNKIYWQSLTYFYENVIQRIPKLGNFLLYGGKMLSMLCNKIGKNSPLILGTFFFIIPLVFLIASLLYNIFITNIHNITFVIIITLNAIFIRFITFFIFILNDFAIMNRKHLDNFLVIKHINKTFIYDFNYKTIKKPTQEKLNLLSTQYEFFREINIFTSAFMFFKKEKVNKIFKPIIIAVFFICTLNLCLKFYEIYLNKFIFIVIAFLIILYEYYQIPYKTTSQTK